MTTADQEGSTPKPADLVFEGGGVKGIGFAGAYTALWEDGYRPECVAGTSAGAITAALVTAGYTGPELVDIVLNEMPFKKFQDRSFLGTLRGPGDIAEFLVARGMHSGDYFLDWITKKLEKKGITKFGDLRHPNPRTENRKYRLQVIASDLSARAMLVLPRDAPTIGVADPDQLEIATAVRMSMSIPVFFKPVVRRVPGKGNHTIVDGGILSNYPIWLFDCPDDQQPTYPTFGMLLVAPNERAPLLPDPRDNDHLAPATNPVAFAKALVETMMEAHDRLYVEQADYARTIPVPTLGVTTTQFNITASKATQLVESGHEAARHFLRSWKFDEYVQRFRQGAPPPRRAAVT